MLVEGPPLELMLRYLSECPSEFLETCMNETGGKQVAAILSDHLRTFGEFQLTEERRSWLLALGMTPRDWQSSIRYWGMLSVGAWLVHHEWFLDRPAMCELGWKWLRGEGLAQLAELVRPELVVSDPDRREEFVRLCLQAHGLRPARELLEQSMDRLGTLNSVERQRVLAATAEAERRAREVREAMARKRALEAASRYGE